jgi:hypothetical protein
MKDGTSKFAYWVNYVKSMGLVIWRKSRVPVIAKMGSLGINSGAHSKNGPGIDSTHGISRPLMLSGLCLLLVSIESCLLVPAADAWSLCCSSACYVLIV